MRPGGGALRKVGLGSLIFAAAQVLARGVNFLLVPVYTRALTPSDYGILAVAATVSGLLTTVLSLSMESAVSQLYLQPHRQAERRSMYGSLLLFWVLGSGGMVVGLDLLGATGALDLLVDVPFQPYLRLVLWTAFLNIFAQLPVAEFTVRERPLPAVVTSVGGSLLGTALAVLLVVGFDQGVLGSLWASLLAAAVGAVVAFVVIVPGASLAFSSTRLREVLGFALPLVPHSAANWALSLSDRFVLQRFLPASQVGLYLLGFQFGGLVLIASSSIHNAFFPVANAYLDDPDRRDRLPRLGTYAFCAVVAAGAAVALLGGEAIVWLTPVAYHPAAQVVPWISLGFVLHGAYLILSRGTFYSRRTAGVPLATILASAAGIGLNFALVPRLGIVAAGVSMVVAYGLLAIVHVGLAHVLHPIPWEYTRIARMLVICISWVAACLAWCPPGAALASKLATLLLLLPGSLLLSDRALRTDLRRLAERLPI